MVQQACEYLEHAPNKEIQLKLIDVLRTVTAGKVCCLYIYIYINIYIYIYIYIYICVCVCACVCACVYYTFFFLLI